MHSGFCSKNAWLCIEIIGVGKPWKGVRRKETPDHRIASILGYIDRAGYPIQPEKEFVEIIGVGKPWKGARRKETPDHRQRIVDGPFNSEGLYPIYNKNRLSPGSSPANHNSIKPVSYPLRIH